MGWLQLTAKMHIISLEMTQVALRLCSWCRDARNGKGKLRSLARAPAEHISDTT